MLAKKGRGDHLRNMCWDTMWRRNLRGCVILYLYYTGPHMSQERLPRNRNPVSCEKRCHSQCLCLCITAGSLCTSQRPAYDHIVSSKQREYTNVEVSRLY